MLYNKAKKYNECRFFSFRTLWSVHTKDLLSYTHTERQAARQASAAAAAASKVPLEYIVMLQNQSQTHSQVSPCT